jgi:hypothetical protein
MRIASYRFDPIIPTRDTPQTSHATVYPIKTWVFAIFPLIEFLAKMTYGSGMKNQG